MSSVLTGLLGFMLFDMFFPPIIMEQYYEGLFLFLHITSAEERVARITKKKRKNRVLLHYVVVFFEQEQNSKRVHVIPFVQCDIVGLVL